MLRKILTIINWAALSLCGFIVSMFMFGGNLNEADSSLATLMVVIALTGMIWVPITSIASVLSVWLEWKVTENKQELLKKPAPYVLFFMTVLLLVMFS